MAEVAKKHGVNDVTVYAWRKRFGKLEVVDVKRLGPPKGPRITLQSIESEEILTCACNERAIVLRCEVQGGHFAQDA